MIANHLGLSAAAISRVLNGASAPFSLPDWLDSSAAATPVILPNARAERTLRVAFDAAQRARGLLAWEPASALSWSQWTRSLWSDLVVTGSELRLLLNDAQELLLWTEIISASRESSNPMLGPPEALASLARSAWKLAASYKASAQLRSSASTRDARLFADWADAFTQRCTAQGYLSPALLDDALRRHVQSGTLAAPPTLHLAGFADLLPTQQTLLDALRARGTTILEHALDRAPDPNDLRATILTPTERDEITSAARWTRQFIQQRRSEGQTASVAILLPSVAEEAGELEAAFRDILAPELQDVTTDLSSTPWEFSTGAPLFTLPILEAALDLAHLALDPLPLQRVSALLLSPYLGVASDPSTGAAFDASILRPTTLLRPEIDLPALLALANRHSTKSATPTWLLPLHQYVARSGDMTRPRTYADWTEFLRGLCSAANWPGERQLTATEFEATRARDSTLDLIATLDFAGRRVPFSIVLQTLDHHLRSTPFTPPSTNAPIQIMPLDDALGSSFDAVLFLRATDANWPPPARPNPLLSWGLQRDLRMPGSDPALAANRGAQFTASLLARSGSVLFTSAAENADGLQRPSPAFAHLPQLHPADLLEPTRLLEPLALDITADADPLPPLPNHNLRGGATVLKLQAACGFLAFAQLRLQSTELDSRTPGFDARESGNLLHVSLQRFWNTVQSRDNLAAMSFADRDGLLTQCIADAISRQPSPQTPWDTAYLALQSERLLRLLRHWLDHELDRGPFTVVRNETAEEITVGPLTLSVRMDRIDQLADGGVVFVDYKTGYAADVKDWLDDRPNDPQLPLYALLPERGDLKGLVFAKVRAGRDAKWLGYQTEEGIFPGSRKNIVDLDEKVEAWRDTLTRLANDFYEGRAHVHPKSFQVNCTRCAQRLLCRLDPESLLSQLSDPEAEQQDEAALDG